MNEWNINTSYGSIHIYKKGNGTKQVLLLHGGGCDSAMLSWREVMEEFDDSYTVYAPDLLAHGQSEDYDKICGEQFYDIHIDCIRQVVQQLGLAHYRLAGLSMGGAIAIGYALKYPKEIETLFLVAPWGITKKMPMHGFLCWYIQQTNFTILQYRWMAKSRKLARWAVAYSLIGHKQRITGEIVDEVWEASKEDRAGKSMQDFQRSSIHRRGTVPYYEKQLSELEMPVIFINGEKDPLVPIKDVKEALQKVKNGKCYILEGCKHWAVKEEPKRFVEIVGDEC